MGHNTQATNAGGDEQNDRTARFPNDGVELEQGDRVYVSISAFFDDDSRSDGAKGAEVVEQAGDDVVVKCHYNGERTVAFDDVYETDLEVGETVVFDYDSRYSDSRVEKTADVVAVNEGRGGAFDGIVVEFDDGREYSISVTGGVSLLGSTSRRVGLDAAVRRLEAEIDDAIDALEQADEQDVATDGGRDDWNPEPATLRDGETVDDDSHAARNLAQIKQGLQDGVIDESDLTDEHKARLARADGGDHTCPTCGETFEREATLDAHKYHQQHDAEIVTDGGVVVREQDEQAGERASDTDDQDVRVGERELRETAIEYLEDRRVVEPSVRLDVHDWVDIVGEIADEIDENGDVTVVSGRGAPEGIVGDYPPLWADVRFDGAIYRTADLLDRSKVRIHMIEKHDGDVVLTTAPVARPTPTDEATDADVRDAVESFEQDE